MNSVRRCCDQWWFMGFLQPNYIMWQWLNSFGLYSACFIPWYLNVIYSKLTDDFFSSSLGTFFGLWTRVWWSVVRVSSDTWWAHHLTVNDISISIIISFMLEIVSYIVVIRVTCNLYLGTVFLLLLLFVQSYSLSIQKQWQWFNVFAGGCSSSWAILRASICI